jgi:hypothetical protein
MTLAIDQTPAVPRRFETRPRGAVFILPWSAPDPLLVAPKRQERGRIAPLFRFMITWVRPWL